MKHMKRCQQAEAMCHYETTNALRIHQMQ